MAEIHPIVSEIEAILKKNNYKTTREQAEILKVYIIETFETVIARVFAKGK